VSLIPTPVRPIHPFGALRVYLLLTCAAIHAFRRSWRKSAGRRPTSILALIAEDLGP
jgi:hypothetical protein